MMINNFNTYDALVGYVNSIMEKQYVNKVINEELDLNKYYVETIELVIDIQNLSVGIK